MRVQAAVSMGPEEAEAYQKFKSINKIRKSQKNFVNVLKISFYDHLK